MASSGTYAYAPDVQEFIDEAFERCGIDPEKLTGRHLRSARRSLNLMFADWATKGVHHFTVDEQTQTLTDGDESYNVASGTMVMLECFVRRDGVDTPVTLIDRAAYAAIPDKTAEGLPNMVFFDRKAGTYTLWNVPENSTDVFHYWRMRRLQDITTGAETPDLPYHWYEALASGLAAYLAIKFNQARFEMLKGIAEQSFGFAKLEDRERTDTSFSVGFL